VHTYSSSNKSFYFTFHASYHIPLKYTKRHFANTSTAACMPQCKHNSKGNFSEEHQQRRKISKPISRKLRIGKMISEHLSSKTMTGKMISKHLSSKQMTGKMISKHLSSKTMIGKMISKHLSSKKMIGKMISEHLSSKTMMGKMISHVYPENFG
jgi:hypothetical protein